MKREYLVGVDLGGTNIKIGLFDYNCRKIAEISHCTNAERPAEKILSTISIAISDLIDDFNIEYNQILAIGLGVPGLMDRKKGISIFSPNFSQWNNVNVVGWMKNIFNCPVFIDNDVRMNLYGEWNFGAGRGIKNFILITIGTGLGAGIVINNRVFYGSNDCAGEFGHMNLVQHNGRPCACGSSGCLGRYVSFKGIERTTSEILKENPKGYLYHNLVAGQGISGKLLDEAYDMGDCNAITVYEKTGEKLGFGLINLINLFNPEKIIVGGGVAKSKERLLMPARKIVNARALSRAAMNCSIEFATLDQAGIYGAAAFAKQQML